MDVIIWPKLVDFKSHFLLETWNHIDKCFEYTVAPGRRPRPLYHDNFNTVLPMLMHYFCFTNATTPVSRPRPQSSCYKTAHRAPRNRTTTFYWYSYAGKLVTCQQQFAELHHVDLKHRECRDAGVSASAVSANVLLQTYNANFSAICTVLRTSTFSVVWFYDTVTLGYGST